MTDHFEEPDMFDVLMGEEENSRALFLEATNSRDIERVKDFLDKFPAERRRATLLHIIDLEEARIRDLHDDRNEQGQSRSPAAVNNEVQQKENDRKNPETFLGKLTILLESYK